MMDEIRRDLNAGEELGRFVVIVNTAESFELWLFDKQQQSDAMVKVLLPITAASAAALGVRIIAWQLEGDALTEP